ncbi:hypothetical protein SCHPADRAFT_627859 [Schizopora paradoxa]|uniref:Uncharacterized protein n=1 Tax=Schizopora paradoxa TaxID=27342 RepID=A0A0H2R974_9AGAM|nr:hypothetical protein SCHPADRAFT_627859 [Schizopora paradoxa]
MGFLKLLMPFGCTNRGRRVGKVVEWSTKIACPSLHSRFISVKRRKGGICGQGGFGSFVELEAGVEGGVEGARLARSV